MTQTSQQPAGDQPAATVALRPADVWRIFRKRFWLIVACFVVLGLGGTGGIIAWYLMAPLYTAEGVVQVQPGQAQRAGLTAGYEQEVPVRLFEPYIQSQARAIKNHRVLSAALAELKGKQTLYTGPNAVYDLVEDLSVVHLPNSQDILVSLTGADREMLQAVVREVLDQYIEQLRNDQAQADAEREQELRAERDDLRRQLEDVSRALERYRDESSVIVSDERASVQMARLNTLVQQLSIAEAELAEARAAWEQFQERRKQAEETGDPAPILTAFPEIMEGLRSDRTLGAMQQQVAGLQQQLEGLKQRFGQQHEQVRRSQIQLQSARNDLEAQRSEIINQLVQQQAAALRNRYDQARTLQADLQARVGEARAAAVSVAKLTAEYRAREQRQRRIEEMLNIVEEGLERMRISAALSRPNIRVASWPIVPVEPSQPRVVLYSVAAVVFSLLVGFGLSLLIELMDTRLRTPAQVARQVGTPVLASVPDLAEDDRLSLETNLALVSHTVPQSLIAEAFRQLRTSLLFASDQPVKTLLISSASPGEGKSIVASNLAVTAARSGSRILLVEANFRRPAMARLFDVPDAIGLSNVLVGLNNASEAIQATAVENLDLLVAGSPPPSPAELLGSDSMRRLVAEQERDYDQVIIDGAPILLVGDNHLLADLVDGVVLVLRADENTRGMAQRAVRQVLSLRARLYGAVLNRVRATKGGYFRESYQAYYDYAGSTPSAAHATTPAASSARSRPSPQAGDEETPTPGGGTDTT